MPTLRWYVQRLRAMSAAELLYRSRFHLTKAGWRRQVRSGQVPTAPPRVELPVDPIPLFNACSLPGVSGLLSEADGYLEHRWFFFGLDGLREPTVGWHSDPTTGKQAPRIFSFDIDHRDPDAVGNIKVLWEKSRHHHLTILAEAYALTGEEKYAEEVVGQIESWIEENPYLEGVHWSHPLEHGIRLIAWVWCERWLRGSSHHARLFAPTSQFWQAVYQHQRFIEDGRSQGSSANNHLIGEWAGLFVSACAWPFFRTSQHWQRLAQKGLEHEMERQTYASGFNKEQAYSYHLFTLEFFLLALREESVAERPFHTAYRSRLRSMAEALPAVADRGGHAPRYGDGDDGMAIQLQAHGTPPEAWLCHAAATLVGADVQGSDQGLLPLRLLGLEPAADKPSRPPPSSVGFEDAGIYVMRSAPGKENEVFVLADAGPHGLPSLFAHAHADALSFTLSAGGGPIFVDPGTYEYWNETPWRNYFRSTRAHNTLAIDERSQSKAAGPFLWTQAADTKVRRWEPSGEGGVLEAEHNGYRRFGITHRRRFELSGNVLSLTDVLTGNGQRRVELFFHLHPDCRLVSQQGTVVHLQNRDTAVRLTAPESMPLATRKGEANAGWYSPRFGRKQESVTLVASGSVDMPTELKTLIEVFPRQDTDHPSITS